MAVTTTNIIIGPCTSFKVDGNDLGGTTGGVQIEKKRTFTDIEVDQYAGVIKKAIKQDTYTVKTTLSEATLANLAIAWDAPAPTVNPGPPQTTTMNMGVASGTNLAPTEHTITFVGPAPNGKTRTFNITRAVSMGTATPVMDRNKETVFAVEFECLPNLANTGAEYGTVVDQ
jgi:hypothetical protein